MSTIVKKPTPVVCYLQPSPQPLTTGLARATWLPWLVLQEAMAHVRDARKESHTEPDAQGLKRGFLNMTIGRELSDKLANLGHQNLCILQREFTFDTTDPDATQLDWDRLHTAAAEQAMAFAKQTAYPVPWHDVDIVTLVDQEWFDNARTGEDEHSKGVRMFLAELQHQGIQLKPVLLDAAEYAGLEAAYSARMKEWLDPQKEAYWAHVAAEQEWAFAEATRLEAIPQHERFTVESVSIRPERWGPAK